MEKTVDVLIPIEPEAAATLPVHPATELQRRARAGLVFHPVRVKSRCARRGAAIPNPSRVDFEDCPCPANRWSLPPRLRRSP